jgi:nucleoside-diphosphate-sugar epimerase
MRLLLTGSNGFIGGRIAEEAMLRGVEVIGLGRAPTPTTPVTRYVRHDLGSPLRIDDRVDAVVHCAALAVPWAPRAAYRVANVDATRHVVQWCGENGLPHLVYVSSSSVFYQHADQFDLTEDSPIPEDRHQINEYSRTKRIGERMVEAYAGNSAVLRPRAVFGPGDTVLLPRILAAARAGRLPLLQRRGGHRVVCDLTYVDNVVHYVLGAVERRVTGAYNLTNGEPVELYPFLFDILDQLGCARPTRRVPLGVAMVVARVAEIVAAMVPGHREPAITRFGISVLGYSKTFDVSRCRADLGPPPVPLAEGVRRLVLAEAERGPDVRANRA